MKKKINKALFSLLALMIFLGYYLYFSDQPTPIYPVVTPEVIQEATPEVAGASTSDTIVKVYFTNRGQTNVGIPLDEVLVGYIDGATVSIDAAFFELDLQNVTDALIRAQQRGVQVRLVYDDEHVNPDPQIGDLLSSQVTATPDERSAFMHNKFVIIDGQCIWTGSFNFTQNASTKNSENALYLCNPELSQNYQIEFEEMFFGQFGPTSPANTPRSQIYIEGILFENYYAPEDEPMDRIIEIVNSAQTSVHFLAFSFTHDGLGEAMLTKKEQGLDISGIFETRGADSEYSECNPLLESGAGIKLDSNSATFHHKIIVVDGSIVIVGSFNFSENASSDNDENLLIIHDPSLAAIYESEFVKLYSESASPSGKTCRK